MRFLELTALDTPDSQINNNSNFNYSTEINVSLAGSNHNTCKDAEGVVDAEAGAEKIIARKTIIMYAIEICLNNCSFGKNVPIQLNLLVQDPGHRCC